MPRHAPSPRRSESVESYRRETRAIAALALLALVAGVVSDALAAHFWGHHALLADLASSAIVVMLSVALVSEALERRRRRRWTVLAQHVMIELIGNARLVWTAVTELASLMPSDAYTKASIAAGTRAVHDTPRLAEAIRQLVADRDRRVLLHEKIARFANRMGRQAAGPLPRGAARDLRAPDRGVRRRRADRRRGRHRQRPPAPNVRPRFVKRRYWTRGGPQTKKESPALAGLSLSTATGIRTRVSAVRGRRPSPLDDSGEGSVRREA
jgi:hypothetical protein